MKSKFKVRSIKKEDGSYEQHVIVPVGLLQESSQKSGLANWFSSFFKSRDSISQDNISKDDNPSQTTAIDVSAAAVASRHIYDQMQMDNTRLAKYEDYEKMEKESSILQRALSVVVNNTFMSRKGDGNSWEVESEDTPAAVKVIDEVNERTSLRTIMPSIYRSGLQYGDGFEEVVFDNKRLITDLRWLPPKNMIRNQDAFGRLLPEASFSLVDTIGANDAIAHLPWWQCVHLRHAHRRGDRYGTAMFYSSRRSFRILRPMEDSVALNRIISGVDRLAITFPVPKNTSAKNRQLMAAEMARKFTTKITVDSDGRVDFNRNPLLDTENFFIGVADGEKASVERISGSLVTDQLSDVEYFQNDLILGQPVPKAYLGLERDINSKATLGWEDIEFARQLRWNQQEVAWFLREIYDRQLQALNMESGKKIYKLVFPSISFIDDEMLWSVMQMRWKIATEARATLGVPVEWLLKEVVGLDDDAIERIVNHPDFRLTNDQNMNQGQESGLATHEATSGELKDAKSTIAQNMNMMNSLHDLKSKLGYVIKHRLNQSVEL
ncbi:MAG: portal protein [Candidatus Thorarchaeota archaeon]